MNEDYLWDRSGAPDAEVVHLEQLLGGLRYRKPAQRWLGRPDGRWMAVAALALVACGLGTAFFVHRMENSREVTAWQLSLAGQKPRAVRTGQVVETGTNTNGTLESEFVGQVDIQPNSRVRVLAASETAQRLALDQGTIHAFIWAPPAQFVVDTPAARTIDLGCEYTLEVSKDGNGLLTVETGWVAFEWHQQESFIPAGAACTTRPGHGPDTPHFLDAPEALTRAVAEFDLTGNVQMLNAALPVTRPRDALTLWHLLQRTHGWERAQVFERFAAVVRLPSSVTQEGIVRGDAKSLDAAWDALQLGETSSWREWKRAW